MKYKVTIETSIDVEVESDEVIEEKICIEAFDKLKQMGGTKECLSELWLNSRATDVVKMKE